MEGIIGGSVLMVAIIEEAGDPGRVPAHQQAGSLGRQSAQDGLENIIPHAGCLVDDIQHMVCMEALEGIRLAGSPGHRKPFFGVSPHIDLFSGPDKVVAQYRVGPQPFCNLSP